MNKIVVNKQKLIAEMKKNRAEHSQIVEEAQVGFREAVIKRLDEMLARARAGKHIDMYIGLQVPEDHTEDYDTVIGMLELDINETVELDIAQYRQWVEDNWGWQQSFTASNSLYSATAARNL